MEYIKDKKKEKQQKFSTVQSVKYGNISGNKHIGKFLQIITSFQLPNWQDTRRYKKRKIKLSIVRLDQRLRLEIITRPWHGTCW